METSLPTFLAPARRTGLQSAVDDTIARLVALRACWPCDESMLSEDNPEDLRGLSEFACASARACDGLFQEIAYQGGLSSRSGASPHANIVTCAIDGQLEYELRERAETIEADAPSPAECDRRDHGTLNHAQQGVGGRR